jgi:hypothetical protein
MRVKDWLVCRGIIHVRTGCACPAAAVTCRKEDSGSAIVCRLPARYPACAEIKDVLSAGSMVELKICRL